MKSEEPARIESHKKVCVDPPLRKQTALKIAKLKGHQNVSCEASSLCLSHVNFSRYHTVKGISGTHTYPLLSLSINLFLNTGAVSRQSFTTSN